MVTMKRDESAGVEKDIKMMKVILAEEVKTHQTVTTIVLIDIIDVREITLRKTGNMIRIVIISHIQAMMQQTTITTRITSSNNIMKRFVELILKLIMNGTRSTSR